MAFIKVFVIDRRPRRGIGKPKTTILPFFWNFDLRSGTIVILGLTVYFVLLSGILFHEFQILLSPITQKEAAEEETFVFPVIQKKVPKKKIMIRLLYVYEL